MKKLTYTIDGRYYIDDTVVSEKDYYDESQRQEMADDIKTFIAKVRKETAECILKEITEKRRILVDCEKDKLFNEGYLKRMDDEKQILKEL